MLGAIILMGGILQADETWNVGEEKRLPAFRKQKRPPGELVQEWQFTEGIEDWVPRGSGIQLSHDPKIGHTVKGCLRVKGVQEDGWNYVWSPRLTVDPGASYQASMWLRVEQTSADSPETFYFKIEMTGHRPTPPTRVNSSTIPAGKVGEWQKMTVEFSVPREGLQHIAFALEKGGRTRRTLDVAIDDVRLERIPGKWGEKIWRDAALRGSITRELRGVHPRLYLNQERLNYLRKAVAEDPFWAPAMRTLLTLADAGVKSGPPDYTKRAERGGELDGGSHEQLWQRGVGNRIPHIALAYLLTGDKQYLDSAKTWVFTALDYPTWGIGSMSGLDLAAGHLLAGIGLAYDWLYHDLTENERAEIREKVVPRAAYLARIGGYEGKAWWRNSYMQNHQWVSLAGMATTAFALADEIPETASWIAVAHDKFIRTLEIAGDDGASHEGYGYWEYGAEYIMRYLEMARTCLGIDLYYDSDGKPHPWLSRNAAYALYVALPRNVWTKRCSVADIGDCPRSHWYGPSYLLRNLARRYPASPWRESAQWLADAFVEADCDAAGSGHYLNFAWYDPGIPAHSPVEGALPLVHHFEDIDIVSVRTSWDENPAQLVVKCGPPLGHKHEQTKKDYGAGHVHPDAGHFLWIAGGKILFRDSGYTKPKATGNHSTVLIDGQGQKGEGRTWFNFRPWSKDPRSPRIRSVKKEDDTTVIDCDVAPAYPAELGLTRFDRTFSFGPNGNLTVEDNLLTKSPSTHEWRFQVEGTLEAQNDCWLLRNDNVTVRIDVAASVPVTVEAATLELKNNPPYLRICTNDKTIASQLRTTVSPVPASTE